MQEPERLRVEPVTRELAARLRVDAAAEQAGAARVSLLEHEERDDLRAASSRRGER